MTLEAFSFVCTICSSVGLIAASFMWIRYLRAQGEVNQRQGDVNEAQARVIENMNARIMDLEARQ